MILRSLVEEELGIRGQISGGYLVQKIMTTMDIQELFNLPLLVQAFDHQYNEHLNIIAQVQLTSQDHGICSSS